MNRFSQEAIDQYLEVARGLMAPKFSDFPATQYRDAVAKELFRRGLDKRLSYTVAYTMQADVSAFDINDARYVEAVQIFTDFLIKSYEHIRSQTDGETAASILEKTAPSMITKF